MFVSKGKLKEQSKLVHFLKRFLSIFVSKFKLNIVYVRSNELPKLIAENTLNEGEITYAHDAIGFHSVLNPFDVS